MVVVQAVATYITDAYPKNAASACGALGLGENMFAAYLPLAAQSMYTTLGFHWASSLLGFLAIILSLVPIMLAFFGDRLRAKSALECGIGSIMIL